MVWFKASAPVGMAELEDDLVNEPVGTAQTECAADEALAIHWETMDDETEAVHELAEAEDEEAAS
jgi:hypothetical protein